MDGHSQRSVVSGSTSRLWSETSGGPQRSVLLPLPFNIFLSDTESGIKCKFEDDTKLSGTVDLTEGRDVIQTDLGKCEKFALENLVMFNKAKCKVLLHLGHRQKKSMYTDWKKNMRVALARGTWVSCGMKSRT